MIKISYPLPLPESSPVSPMALWSQPLPAKTHQTGTLSREQARPCLPLPLCLTWVSSWNTLGISVSPLWSSDKGSPSTSTSPATEACQVQDGMSPSQQQDKCLSLCLGSGAWRFLWVPDRSKPGVCGTESTCICDHICTNVQLSVPFVLSLNQCWLCQLALFAKGP